MEQSRGNALHDGAKAHIEPASEQEQEQGQHQEQEQEQPLRYICRRPTHRPPASFASPTPFQSPNQHTVYPIPPPPTDNEDNDGNDGNDDNDGNEVKEKNEKAKRMEYIRTTIPVEPTSGRNTKSFHSPNHI